MLLFSFLTVKMYLNPLKLIALNTNNPHTKIDEAPSFHGLPHYKTTQTPNSGITHHSSRTFAKQMPTTSNI